MGKADAHELPHERVQPPASVPSTRSPSPLDCSPLSPPVPLSVPRSRFASCTHMVRSPVYTSPERPLSSSPVYLPSFSSPPPSIGPSSYLPSISPTPPSSLCSSSPASSLPSLSPLPSPPQTPPPTHSQRVAVLTYDQVTRLHDVMTEQACVIGKGNFPMLDICPMDLIRKVCSHCDETDVFVRDVRLNGGAASHVLCGTQPYNDLDLIFSVDLRTPNSFEKVKMAVLAAIRDLLPVGVSKDRLGAYSLKDAYVSKLVKVSDEKTGDLWSLIAVGHRRPGERGRTIELKFVDTMNRQFEFSVDSFQILLDSLISFYAATKTENGQKEVRMSESCFPSVLGESVYGDFSLALDHLYRKVIATRCPEQIRGGGLLKYCSLLARGFHGRLRDLERYMCSRFFIDFSSVKQQNLKFTGYLEDHFEEEDGASLRYRFLEILFSVISDSTVCLMGHERTLTLTLVYNLSLAVLNRSIPAPTIYCYYGPAVPPPVALPCLSCVYPYQCGNCWVPVSSS